MEAAEKCYDLLSQLGREEEMKIVRNIMKALSKDLHSQNAAASNSKHNSHNGKHGKSTNRAIEQ